EADNSNTHGIGNIKSLYLDPKADHILWIGTNGQGLIKMNTKTLSFEKITERDGLSDNTIYGILPEQGNSENEINILWLSTNMGLSRFNFTTGQIQRYIKFNGLQDNE